MNMTLIAMVISMTAIFANAAIPKKASVFVQPMKLTDISDQLIYPGRVKSRINTVASSEIEGQVIKIKQQLGNPVKRGDVVLVLQNTDPVYRYAPIKVRAQSDGYITTLDITLLAKVERGQKLFTITDPKNLLIEIEIPAADLTSIRQGMIGLFKPNVQDSTTLKAVIEGLSPVVDIRTGTATAEIKPLEKINLLNQGQLGQFTLQMHSRKSFVVPDSAITYRGDHPYLRVIQQGKVQKIPVELGPRMGDSYEIKTGLQEGAQVVLRTSRFVSDGEAVDVEAPTEKM